MAILGIIRGKSVFLFVVIIIALLAFILGDLIKSKRFVQGTDTSVFQTGSVKINQKEYSEAYKRYSDQYKQYAEMMAQYGQNVPALVPSEAEQQVLMSLAMSKLLNQQSEKGGIKVGENLLSSRMFANDQNRMIYNIITNPSLAAGYTQEMIDELKEGWQSQEQEQETEIQNELFNSLLGGLFQPNKLDAQTQYDNTFDRKNISYVSVPVIAAADTVPVTDSELRAAWEKNKNQYYIDEPQVLIDYIVVPIMPSATDMANAASKMADVQAALESTDGMDGIAGVNGIDVMTVEATKDMIKDSYPTLTDSDLDNAGTVTRLPGNRTRIELMKVLGVENKLDSITFSLYVNAAPNEADSILNLIAAGTPFDSIIAQVGPQKASKDITWPVNGPGTEALPASLRNYLIEAPVGQVKNYSDSTMNMDWLVRVDKRGASVPFVEVGLVSYDILPSSDTQQLLSSRLNSFVASNPKAELFSAAAPDSAYMVFTELVSASSPYIGASANAPLDDTRKMLKWIMDESKPGNVSGVYRTSVNNDPNNEVYYVVAVQEKYKGDYIPYNAKVLAKPSRMFPFTVDQQARRARAAQKIVDDFAGKATDLNGYAELMNSSVQTANGVTVTGRNVGVLGQQSVLGGLVAGATPGQVVGPIAGDNQVIVFVAEDDATPHREFSEANDKADFMRSYGIGQNNIMDILLGSNKINNKSLRYVLSINEQD